MQTIIEARETAQAEKPATPPAVRWALAGLALSMLLSSLGTSIANVGLPTLAQAFNATFHEVQWVVLAYLLAVTSLIVSVGRLGDLVGRRKLLLAGIFLFTTASIFCGVAPTLGLLICARAAQGLGAAAMMSLTMAFVGETVPKPQTGRAMGLLGTMSAVGTAFGPSLGGILIATVGWRGLFLVNVPIGVAALLLTRKHLPADRHSSLVRARFDWVGTLLLAFAVGTYALAMTIGRGDFSFVNLALLAVATLATGLFVFVETRVPAPLIRLASLGDRVLTAGLLTSGLVSTVMMTTLVVGPFYLATALGLEPSAVGLAVSVGPLFAALMSVQAGRLADRLGAQRVTVIGLMGIVAGAVTLGALPAPFGVLGYLAPIGALTIGYALFQTANNTAVMRDIPADQRGVASAMLSLSRNLGLVTGASMMGAVFAFASNSADLTKAEPAAIATGMRATFAIAAALVVVALAVALRSGAKNATHARIIRNVSASPKAGFLIPAGLLVLSLVPGIAGTSRLVQLAHGAEITQENARFFATPMPVVLHIVSAVLYSVMGAFQFSAGFRLRHPRWHRAAGRLLIPCGFIAALSALWMTQYFPLGKFQGPLVADFDGRYLYAIRLMVGAAMIVFLSLGVATILQRDFRRHGAWMIRAYALGLGAGTQVFTHIPWFLFPSVHGELARTLCMAAGWAINAAVAEWVIFRMSHDTSARRPDAHSATLPRSPGVVVPG